MNSNDSTNPYVGPVPYQEAQKDLFFGREREAEILLSLAISERVVMFYAQSGAGKSSLVNARLIPRLKEKDYRVLPLVRVGGALPSDVTAEKVQNVYVFNALKCMNASKSSRSLSRETLDGYLAKTKNQKEDGIGLEESQSRYLILDQFEEILTTYPEHWEKREEFFQQLRNALNEDSRLNIVFVLREDHLAGFDRYASLIPDGLRVRYRMERLGSKAALEAIKGPAEKGGRPFNDRVAEELAADLSSLPVADQDKTFTGEFVEPMQLQIVCFQLWESLRTHEPKPITMKDLKNFGDTNSALGRFYDDAVKRVAGDTSVTEGLIRRWFGETLITPSRTRAQVNRGLLKSGGLSSKVVDLLLDRTHLIRVEEARGGKWIELGHDRFIDPILESNRRFQLLHGYSFLSTAAKIWHDNSEDESFLFRGRRLIEAQNYYDAKKDSLGTLERDFLSASSKMAVKQSRGLKVAIGLLVVLLAVAVWFAWESRSVLKRANREAEKALMASIAETMAKKEAGQKEALANAALLNLAKTFFLQKDNPSEIQMDANALDQILKANDERLKIVSGTDASKRHSTIVQYFKGDLDTKKVKDSLQELGFNVQYLSNILYDSPTNSIWFGNAVDIEDVKLIALTLIRSGIQLRNIRPYQNRALRPSNIQVGGKKSVMDKPILTVDQIRTLTREGL